MALHYVFRVIGKINHYIGKALNTIKKAAPIAFALTKQHPLATTTTALGIALTMYKFQKVRERFHQGSPKVGEHADRIQVSQSLTH